MEQSFELMFGLFMLGLSLSFIKRAEHWANWCIEIGEGGSAAAFSVGCFGLLISVFILAAYPYYHGLYVIITVIGILGLMEATLYLLFPSSLGTIVKALKPYGVSLVQYAGLILAVMAFLTLNKLYQDTTCIGWIGENQWNTL